MRYPLRDSVVVITGASSGIGRACALRFAARGARLMLSGRNPGRLQDAAREAEALGAPVGYRPADVTDLHAMQELVAEAERQFGPVDIAVACAGQYIRAHASELRPEMLRASLEVNLFGSMNLIFAVLPGMLERRRGRVVAVTSVDGKKGLPLDAAYCAAKFAMTGLLDCMRQDLRGSGVRLCNVLPGRVDTPMIAGLQVPRVSRKISAERVARAVERATRSGRAEVIVPLAGPKTLIVAGACSPRLADWLVRLFRLEGTVATMDNED
ncbi:MAG TPA: SDR family NAD(P)-dependent oxidoreductase [Bacteroidota bacterium]